MSLNKQLDSLFEDQVFEQELDEDNVTGSGEVYNTRYAFGKKEDENDNAEVLGYKKVKTESAFLAISKQLHLGEAKYNDYKRDESLTARQKVNKSITEVNGKLFRIERILDQNIKLKTESGIDESKYWEITKRNLLKIEHKMTRLVEKLRNF